MPSYRNQPNAKDLRSLLLSFLVQRHFGDHRDLYSRSLSETLPSGTSHFRSRGIYRTTLWPIVPKPAASRGQLKTWQATRRYLLLNRVRANSAYCPSQKIWRSEMRPADTARGSKPTDWRARMHSKGEAGATSTRQREAGCLASLSSHATASVWTI